MKIYKEWKETRGPVDQWSWVTTGKVIYDMKDFPKEAETVYNNQKFYRLVEMTEEEIQTLKEQEEKKEMERELSYWKKDVEKSLQKIKELEEQLSP